METLQDFNKIYPSAIYVQLELQSLSLKFSFCINFFNFLRCFSSLEKNNREKGKNNFFLNNFHYEI